MLIEVEDLEEDDDIKVIWIIVINLWLFEIEFIDINVVGWCNKICNILGKFS